MNRRNFLVVLSAFFISFFSKAIASVKIYVTEGKLGYRLKGSPGRDCEKCKYFKQENDDGECQFVVMRRAMKSNKVYVKKTATCNMWSKK